MNARQIVSEVVAGIRRQGRGVLLFDFDGTLAPIVDQPRLARMSPRMRRAIEGLLGRPSIAVGVLSGRGLGDLRQVVGIPGLYLAGLCGLELDLCGQVLSHPDAPSGRKRIEALLHELGQPLQNWPLAWVEDKELGLTVHYRAVPQEDTAHLLTCVRDVLDRFRGSVQVKQGPLAIEVLPAFGWTKETAVREILKRLPYRKPFVLFAGDSTNDADAFAEVERLGGATIGVGDDSPHGPRYRLEDPGELASVLQDLVGQLKDIAPRSGSQSPFRHFADARRVFFPVGPM